MCEVCVCVHEVCVYTLFLPCSYWTTVWRGVMPLLPSTSLLQNEQCSLRKKNGTSHTTPSYTHTPSYTPHLPTHHTFLHTTPSYTPHLLTHHTLLHTTPSYTHTFLHTTPSYTPYLPTLTHTSSVAYQ